MEIFLDLFFNQIFGQPFLLMGIIVFIGYVAMKQSIDKAFSGALKASIGILIMGMGATVLITNFNKLLLAMQVSTGIQGAGLNTYPTMINAYEKMELVLGAGIGTSWGIYTLLGAFLVNLFLVAFRKYTKIRAVYLTGNAMIVQAGITTYIVWRFLNLDMLGTVLISAIITALYWGIMSTLLIKPTSKITNGADFTIAHQQMFMDYLAYKIAPYLGNEKDDIEKKKMPASLSFLQDSIVTTALVMFLSVAVILLIITPEQLEWLRSSSGLNQPILKNNIIFILWTSFILTASIVVLLFGVRMFIGELMISFKGISDRLLPGAIAGVDCAAIFAFAPKSVVLGLIFGAIGQVVGLLGLVITNSSIFIVPGFIPLFFDNAAIAIFANKFGGWKAAAIICTVNGIIQIWGSMLAVKMMEMTWWQGSSDYATIWVLIIGIFKCIGSWLGIPIAG